MTGQVNSLRSRAEAAEAEIGRLAGAHTEAVQRAEQAGRAFTSLETQVAGLDDGELGLDSAHEEALEAKELLEAELGALRTEERAATQERAALAARLEALQVGLLRKDATGALLAATEPVQGLLGSVAALVTVRGGYETAVAAALGAAADAVAVTDVDAALGAVALLKTEDLGRAGLLLAGPRDRMPTPPMIEPSGRTCPTAPCTRSTWSRRPPTSPERRAACCARSPWSTTCRRPGPWSTGCRT